MYKFSLLSLSRQDTFCPLKPRGFAELEIAQNCSFLTVVIPSSFSSSPTVLSDFYIFAYL